MRIFLKVLLFIHSLLEHLSIITGNDTVGVTDFRKEENFSAFEAIMCSNTFITFGISNMYYLLLPLSFFEDLFVFIGKFYR